MNDDEKGCIGFVMLAAFVLVAGFAIGERVGNSYGFEAGYTQALADAKNGVSPQYRLVEQENGESKWEKVGK